MSHKGQQYKGVSIHASVKDATKANALATRAIMVSIHASVKDATKYSSGTSSNGRVSIHASVKDATRRGEIYQMSV